jgi:uncharacterized membrane protein YjjP (DUF1212 family)
MAASVADVTETRTDGAEPSGNGGSATPAPNPSARNESDAIEFVLALAKALHRYGTPAHRLEEAVRVICLRLDLEVEVFTTPTAIIMSFGEPTELRTRLMRVEGGELDMDNLEQVDDLADEVAAQTVTPGEGVVRLEKILSSPRRYGRVLSTIAHAFTSGGLAVSFGGTIIDVALAGAIGLLLGLLAQVAQRSTDQARVFELLGAAFVSFAAEVMSSVVTTTPSLVTIAALIVLLPGMSLTVAMTELATRHLIAGTARLMSAVIVLLELVIGVAVGDRLARALVDVHHAVPVALPSWTQSLALVGASLGIAVVVQAQHRAFLWILAACTIGYVGTALGSTWLDPQLGVVVGAFAVGVLGNVFARLMERPAQVVQVPAMLLLVPGSMGFRGMASLLGHDTLSGVETVFAMFVVALAIVAGLLIANAVVSPRRSL